MTSPSLYGYYAVLPHNSEPLLLLLQTQQGWSLPHWHTTQRAFWQTCDHIDLTIQNMLHLDVITLRCLRREVDTETGGHIRIHELENRDRSWAPPAHGAWVSHDDLHQLQLTPPAHREVLEAWFREKTEGVPSRRRAWSRPGWFDETARWMIETLRSQGIAVDEAVTQVRTWERSCLLRVATSVGQVYCKAVPAMFAHEVSLSQSLGTRYPALAPRVLAQDCERHLLLMRDFGGPSLSDLGDFERWEQTVRTFASLQRESRMHIESLVAMGCPYRPLEELPSDISTLLADTDALFLDGRGLTHGEIEALRSRLPHFLDLCQELSTYRLPYALEHGDFGPANVAWVAQAPLFFDWSDSSVAHPFFSLCFFPGELEEIFPTTPDWQRRQQTAYLDPWAQDGSLEQLQRAFEIAQCLAPLHHASRYHRFILPQMEAKWEMELMIPAYLRCL